MKVTVLGSGTSKGIPIIGCRCPACTSIDPKDKRLRVSVFIEADTLLNSNPLKILIDTSPDFRQQMLTNGFTDIDAVLYTHYHADHLMGLDDISQINYAQRKRVPLYANHETADKVRQTFNYIFDENTFKGGGLPQVSLNVIDINPFDIKGEMIIPLEYMHGPTKVYGYRIGNFAYMTDCSFIPESEFPKLTGLKVLIIDALRYTPHETHFSFDEAIAVSRRIGAGKTYFTHMTHDIVHAEASAKLPEGIELSYDGLSFEI